MKNLIPCLVLLSACLTKGQAQSLKHAGTLHKEEGKYFLVEDGRKCLVNEKVITVKLKKTEDLDAGITLLRKNKLGYIDILVPDSVSLEDFAEQLDKSCKYDMIKYNTFASVCFIPNDGYLYNQWYLNRIRAYDAWNFTMGSPNVKVGVIDNFPTSTHPDLYCGADIYENIDWSCGYDYTGNFTSSHGLSVAGIISAKTNNYIGIAGICGGNYAEGVCVYPYNVSSGGNHIDMSVVDDAIIDATDNGVRVINMSFRSNQSYYPDVNDAISYAYNHNVLLVAGTGNDSTNNWIGYPASHPLVVSVASVNDSSTISYFSNVGEGLDIVAPGEDIYCISDNSGYDFCSGTSCASPQVAGVAALVLSANPSLTNTQLRTILCNSAHDLGSSGYDTTYGFGLVDAYEALLQTLYITGPSIPENSSVYTIANMPNNYTVTWNYSGTTMMTATVTPNSPAQNQCTICNPNKEYIHGTLTATIWHNNTIVKTLSKTIITSSDFSGYYSQASQYVGGILIPASSGSICNEDSISVYKGATVTLTSQKFNGASVTYSGASPRNWSHSGNTISFMFKYISPIIPFRSQSLLPDAGISEMTIIGNYPNNYECWQFKVTGINPTTMSSSSNNDEIDAPSIWLSNESCTINIPSSMYAGELVITNFMTGQIVHKCHIDSHSIKVSTIGWPQGVFIVKIKANGEVFTKKIVNSR